MIEVESSHRKEENSPVKYVNGGLQSLVHAILYFIKAT